jgi:acyl carrier protein
MRAEIVTDRSGLGVLRGLLTRRVIVLEQKVTEAFIDGLDLEPGTDVTGLAYREHPKWTSLGHMTLVAALEEKFDTILDADDILAMSSFGKAVEIMKKYDAAA